MAHKEAQRFANGYFGEGVEVLENANPNRNGWIVLVKYKNEFFTAFEDDPEFEPMEAGPYKAEADARTVYEQWREEQGDTPNWDAQAEYDQMHGTVNGQDPGIVEMNELWGEY